MILFLITLFGNFIMWREWNQWHPDFNVHFINREAQASTDEKNAVQQLSVSALPKAVDASRAELWPRHTLHTQSNTAGSEEPCWLNFCSPNHEMTEPAVNIKSSNQSWFQEESFCKSTCCAYPQLVDKGRSARKILTVQTLAELAELQSLLSPFSSQKVKLPLVSPKMLRCIQPGALIYVPTNLVSRHFSLIHPILPHPYVLLSGDTDASAEPFRYLQHLDSPKLLHWFGHNADFGNQTITHPKFSAVPLGVGKNSLFDPSVYINRVLAKRGIESPWTSSAINCVQQWKKQKHAVLLNKELGIERSVCPSQLFVSFNVKNHPSRAHLWDLLCMMHTPNVTCFYRMGTDVAYIMSMAREHLYGLSPRGIGRDCYRTWWVRLLKQSRTISHALSYSLFHQGVLVPWTCSDSREAEWNAGAVS